MIKSDPPTAQRRSPQRPQGQATGGPKIQPGMLESSAKPAEQPSSKKRKMIFYDDDDDDDDASNKEATGKQPKKASPPKKKTTRRPIPKIRKSSRYEPASIFANTSSNSGDDIF